MAMTTTQSDNTTGRDTSAISSGAAWLAIAAVLTYQVLLAALLFLRPDLDPYWHTISEWAIGPYGWVMTLAFLLSALSYAALWFLLRSQIRGLLGRMGLGILLICGIGTVGVGLFTTDPLGTPPDAITTRGMIHMIAGFGALMLLPFAALLINLSLALKNQAWASARRILLWTGLLPLLGLVGFWVHLTLFVLPLPVQYGPAVPLGWPNRCLLLTYMVWLITLAWQTRKVRSQPA